MLEILPPDIFIGYQSEYYWYVSIFMWLAGAGLLVISIYSLRLERFIKSGYKVVSSILRPPGLILIYWGWLEILGQKDFPGSLGMPEDLVNQVIFIAGVAFILIIGVFRPFVIIVAGMLFILKTFETPGTIASFVFFWAAVFFFLWGLWKSGVRRSLFFDKVSDPLVITGPYALVRHPQYLGMLMTAFGASFLFQTHSVYVFHPFGLVNILPFGLVLWAVSRLEEREIKKRFGKVYERYAASTPSLFPLLWGRGTYTRCEGCKIEFPGEMLICPRCGPGTFVENFTKSRFPSSCFEVFAVIGLAMTLATVPLMRGKSIIVNQPIFIQAKQGEARVNLRSIHMAQVLYYSNYNTYTSGAFIQDERTDAFKMIRWKPFSEDRNSYAYCIGDSIYEPGPEGLSPEKISAITSYAEEICPTYSWADYYRFKALAIGDIDDDAAKDIWMINQDGRIMNVINDIYETESRFPSW